MTDEFKEQFNRNEETIARGLPNNCFVVHVYEGDRTRADDGDEPGSECPECGEIVPVSELKADEVCNSCFKARSLIQGE